MTKNGGFLWYEDCTTGHRFTGGPVTVSKADIIAFASSFDPQFFHTDPAAARDSLFGELVASGWHTAALTMKMVVAALPPIKGGMVGRGVENMSWPRPVKPGDTLSYTGEILSARLTKNPVRGIVSLRNVTSNQHGETVMEMTSHIFMPVRGTSD